MEKSLTACRRFSHGGITMLEDGTGVVSSYHPSQQNTQTGKLTEAMFDDVFVRREGLANQVIRGVAAIRIRLLPSGYCKSGR